MIGKQQLNSIAMETGLPLYQQEKDYLLTLFLYSYYEKFDSAVFKGGTCLRYLFSLQRFSEDLDFNIQHPKQFQEQVQITLSRFQNIGIIAYFRKEESFPDAYTCDIGFQGPLYKGTAQTENKFCIDAGYRTGTIKKPVWKLITSHYPETKQQFLVQIMDMEELFAEKVLALLQRNKGRDLYDVWFLCQAGIKFNKDLFEKKSKKENITLQNKTLPTKAVYERDMQRLTTRVLPYEQIKMEVVEFLKKQLLYTHPSFSRGGV